MTTDTHKIRSIFLDAVENHRPEQWRRFLDEACAGDEESRRRVEALLRGHTAYNGILDRPVPPNNSAIMEGPGSVIGPYKLMEQIGEGGMGLVFIAEQQQPVRRKVALKVIKPGMDTRQVVARFEAERQALALMDHPNIARVLDGGSTVSGRPFFVMELVKGVPITDFCDQERLTPRERIELFIDVCQAVQHAHQRGIIHRDLKPSNVLITSHDGTPVVKVIDFGVAKSMGPQLTEKTVYTQLTQFLGTPLYMSPEQAGQSGLDVDTRTDIYALGVLLYELLTGTTPFDETRFKKAANDEIRRIIREEDPPRPSTRISTLLAGTATALTANRQSDPRKLSQFLRGELDWIVMKCLEKDRKRRYATANGLATDLQRYLRNENVQACPPSAWYQFRKFVQRNRNPVGVAAALGVTLLLAVAHLSISNIRIRQEQDQTRVALNDVSLARTELQDTLKREQHRAYFQRIARADLEWWAFNAGRADQILQDCNPEFRDWEWRYLKRLCRAEIATLPGHTQAVRTLVLSPDGRRLASAADDCTIRIWTLLRDSGDSSATDVQHSVVTLHGHEQPVVSVAFSPDGKYLASASGDWRSNKPGEVKIWELASHEEVGQLVGNQSAVGGVAFSPDGTLLATAGWDWTLRLWDRHTGKELRRWMHAGSLKCVAFSPDGKQLVTGGYDSVLTAWNVEDGQKLRTLRGHTGSILSVAFSPDGQQLVSGSWDHTARIWNAATGQLLQTLRGHRQVVYSTVFSPDGGQVASVCSDSSVKLWESSTGRELQTLRGHTGQALGVAFSAGGRCLFTAGADLAIKMWDLATPILSQTWILPDANQPRLAISRDGQRLAVANRRLATRKAPVRVRVFDAHTGKQMLALPEHPDGCFSVSYRPDGKQLVTDWGNLAKSWDADSGRESAAFVGHSGQVTAIAVHPDGKVIATGSADKTARIWDAVTAKELAVLSGHGAAVSCVAFHTTDAAVLATGSKDNNVRIWDWKSRLCVAELAGHRAWITDIAFSRDGRWLASASEDGDIRIWDMGEPGRTSGKLLHLLSGRAGVVHSVSFSPDGKRLASAHEDGTVTLWDVATGQEALSMRHQMMLALHAVFSPDGHRLFASGPPMGTSGSGVTIWSAETGDANQADAIRHMLKTDAAHSWEIKARVLAASNLEQAIGFFSKAMELGGDDPALRLERGTQYAKQGKWAAAAADFAAGVQKRPDDARLWYRLAAAQLGGNDLAAYQETRAAILDRFGGTSEPAIASHLLYICVAVPAKGDAETLVRLGHAAIPLFPGNERILAAALYRHGDYQAALDQFERAAKVYEPRGWDWLFRALAHKKLGHDARAQECFEAGVAWIERANKAAAPARSSWVAWYEPIETGCLRDEAALLLQVKK